MSGSSRDVPSLRPLRSGDVAEPKIVEQLFEDLGLFRSPMALRLLPQQEEYIDEGGGLPEITIHLARHRVGGIAERHGRGAREHDEEPGQGPLGRLVGLLGRPWRWGRVRPGLGPGSRYDGGFAVLRPPPAVGDREGVLRIAPRHTGEPSI